MLVLDIVVPDVCNELVGFFHTFCSVVPRLHFIVILSPYQTFSTLVIQDSTYLKISIMLWNVNINDTKVLSRGPFNICLHDISLVQHVSNLSNEVAAVVSYQPGVVELHLLRPWIRFALQKGRIMYDQQQRPWFRVVLGREDLILKRL